MRLLAERARGLSASEQDALLTELYAGDRFRRDIAAFMAVVAGY
jgi:hypothetical protein